MTIIKRDAVSFNDILNYFEDRIKNSSHVHEFLGTYQISINGVKTTLLQISDKNDYDIYLLYSANFNEVEGYYKVANVRVFKETAETFLAATKEMERIGLLSIVKGDPKYIGVGDFHKNPKIKESKTDLQVLDYFFQSVLKDSWLDNYIGLPALNNYIKNGYKTDEQLNKERKLANQEEQNKLANAVSDHSRTIGNLTFFVALISAFATIVMAIITYLNWSDSDKVQNIKITNPIELMEKAVSTDESTINESGFKPDESTINETDTKTTIQENNRQR